AGGERLKHRAEVHGKECTRHVQLALIDRVADRNGDIGARPGDHAGRFVLPDEAAGADALEGQAVYAAAQHRDVADRSAAVARNRAKEIIVVASRDIDIRQGEIPDRTGQEWEQSE